MGGNARILKDFVTSPNNIEKDLFVIYAVDTVRGCNHPIIANLQDFVSFSKKYIRNMTRKIYCIPLKGNKIDQFSYHNVLTRTQEVDSTY